jgi:hypothetical protein
MGQHHDLSCRISAEDYRDLQVIARREDRSVSSLVRTGIQRVLADKSEAAAPVKGDGLEVARPGATCVPA